MLNGWQGRTLEAGGCKRDSFLLILQPVWVINTFYVHFLLIAGPCYMCSSFKRGTFKRCMDSVTLLKCTPCTAAHFCWIYGHDNTLLSILFLSAKLQRHVFKIHLERHLRSTKWTHTSCCHGTKHANSIRYSLNISVQSVKLRSENI